MNRLMNCKEGSGMPLTHTHSYTRIINGVAWEKGMRKEKKNTSSAHSRLLPASLLICCVI